MKRKGWIITLVVIFLLIIIGIGCSLFFMENKVDFGEYEYHGLPIIDIALNDVTLDEIDNGDKKIKYENNSMRLLSEDAVIEYDSITISGRGNGTWAQDKKPYSIKFKEKEDLFGMGRARKWNLLANAMDDTFLRNETAFKLAKMLKMEYSLEGRFVELYVNKEYRGLYYLTHAVEIGKTGVNLKDPNGVLVELDNLYGSAEKHYEALNGELLVVKELVNDDNEKQAMENSFLTSFNSFEEALKTKNYKKIEELIDVESFAKYYLLSEFSVNPDAYWTSFYMYKDGIKDKIHAGPAWDFDIAFGNRRWKNWIGEDFYSPTSKMIRKQEFRNKEFYDNNGINDGYETSLLISKIIFDLMEIEEFEKVVTEVYSVNLLGRKEELIGQINRKKDEILEAGIIDNKTWDKGEFESETEEMIDWIEKRYDYFEYEYGDKVRIGIERSY